MEVDECEGSETQTEVQRETPRDRKKRLLKLVGVGGAVVGSVLTGVFGVIVGGYYSSRVERNNKPVSVYSVDLNSDNRDDIICRTENGNDFIFLGSVDGSYKPISYAENFELSSQRAEEKGRYSSIERRYSTIREKASEFEGL